MNHESEKHECTACSCDYTDDEGGIQGYFGMLPMSFCPTCLSSIYDMMEQLNPREWIDLNEKEILDVWADYGTSKPETFGLALQRKLKEVNGFD